MSPEYISQCWLSRRRTGRIYNEPTDSPRQRVDNPAGHVDDDNSMQQRTSPLPLCTYTRNFLCIYWRLCPFRRTRPVTSTRRRSMEHAARFTPRISVVAAPKLKYRCYVNNSVQTDTAEEYQRRASRRESHDHLELPRPPCHSLVSREHATRHPS